MILFTWIATAETPYIPHCLDFRPPYEDDDGIHPPEDDIWSREDRDNHHRQSLRDVEAEGLDAAVLDTVLRCIQVDGRQGFPSYRSLNWCNSTQFRC